jgi:hypothetical protein
VRLHLLGGLCITTSCIFAQEIATHFQYPLTVPWVVTQQFGKWNAKYWGFHLAEDVGVPVPPGKSKADTELPVRAAGNGKVRHAKPHAGFGWVVLIEHTLPLSDPFGPNVTTLYAHLRQAGIVAENTIVKKNDIIGFLASDRTENGGYEYTHIHFGIKKGTVPQNINTCDPISKWSLYPGYTTIFKECFQESTRVKRAQGDADWSSYEPMHRDIVDHWIDNPSSFITERLQSQPVYSQTTDASGAIHLPMSGHVLIGSFTTGDIPVDLNGATIQLTLKATSSYPTCNDAGLYADVSSSLDYDKGIDVASTDITGPYGYDVYKTYTEPLPRMRTTNVLNAKSKYYVWIHTQCSGGQADIQSDSAGKNFWGYIKAKEK